MQNEQNYRDILRVEFQSRKARNQYYSLRAFAQSIGIGSGALSEILNGKRNLGLNKASAIVEKLNFDDSEKEAFLNSVQSLPTKVVTENEIEKRELTLEVFELVSSPSCMAILAASDLDGFKLNTSWISEKLDIDLEEVEYALNLMEKVGLVENINGDKVICSDLVISPTGIPSRAIKNYHHQMLTKASTALEEQPVDMREISGVSFAMNSKDVPKIKKEILNFKKRLIKKYSGESKNQVYHIEFALFA